ncbi:MAG: hypothetical protein C0621_03000 [Desulfuromonas sp.]|nr:MAG: hypothetical protein C0621_03000 [Desulfuromonas sp.]
MPKRLDHTLFTKPSLDALPQGRRASLALIGEHFGSIFKPLVSWDLFWKTVLFLLIFIPATQESSFAWPTSSEWIPIYSPDGYVSDPGGNADTTGNGNNSTDIVGDPTYPAAYIYNDGIDIYFRLRIDADPMQGSALEPFGWGVLIDTDLDAHDYEYMLMLDGIANPDEIYLAKNVVQENIDDPSDKPEQIEWIKTATEGVDYVASLADSSFTGDADYFLDFKVPYDIFLLSLGINESSLLRYFYGTSQSAQQLSADLISSTIYDGVSDFTLPAGKRPTTGTIQFVADLAGNGDVTEFYPGATLYLKVVDDDQNGLTSTAETVTVTLTTPSGDEENLTLTETDVDSGIFTGSIVTAQSSIVQGNNSLQTVPIEFVTATYIDGADADLNQDQPRTDLVKAKPTADLEVSKSVSTSTPNNGETVTFTLTLNNHGPSNATGIQVKDLLDSRLLYVSDSGAGSYNPTTGIWTISSLANGASITLQIQATIDAPAYATIDNTVSILTTSQPDFDLSNNSATITLAVTGADLEVSKTVAVTTPAIGGDTPQTGDQVTYTITLLNKGSYDATGVVISDPLPSGLSYLSDNSSGSYTPGTGAWNVGNLANGANTSLQIVALVTASGGTTVTNSASISAANESDPVSGNNSASVNIYVDAADLAISKSVDSATPDEGDTVTYTVAVSNLRGSTVGGIQVLDLLPTSLQFVSATPAAGTTYDSASGLWDFGVTTLASGSSATLTLSAQVKTGTASQTLTNTATIQSASKIDPDSSNNSASVAVTVRYLDLAIDKQTSNYSPNDGDPITFTLTITNNGPIDATGVQVYDELPLHIYNTAGGADNNVAVTTSFSDPTDSYNLTSWIWDVGDLASGASATLTIDATVHIPKGSSSTFFNMAMIQASDQADPFHDNDADSVLIGVQGTDIAVTKSVDKLAPAAPNGTIYDIVTYTVTVSNNGPNDATNLDILESLPAGLSYVAGSASDDYTPPAGKTDQTAYTASTGLWRVGYKDGGNTLFPAYTTVTLTLQAEVTAASGSIISNTARVNSLLESDTNPLNDSATATITVGGTDLQILKSVDDATPTVGDTVTFTLTLNNLGPNLSTGIQVKDLLPSGLTYLSHSAGMTYIPATGIWDLSALSLASGDSTSIDIIATVDADDSGLTLINSATIETASAPDPISSNNSASVSITIQESDLYLIKTVSNATPDETTTTVFTLTLGNDGPNDASGVQVLDTLPVGMTYVSSLPALGTVSTTINPDGTSDILWDLGVSSLAKASTTTLAITVLVDAGTGATTLTNSAAITVTGNYDPNSGNNSATLAITPNKIYIDLAVAKSVDNAAPGEGTDVTYTVTVANNNASYAATGVQVTDLLPAGIVFSSATPTSGSYDDASGLWDIGSIAASDVVTLTLVAQPAIGTGGAGPFTNSASISASDYDDPDNGNNSASVDINPVHVATPSLTVLKSVFAESDPVNGTTSPYAIPGATMRYEIQVLNFGDASPDAASLIINDPIPAGTTLIVSGTPVTLTDGAISSGLSLTYGGLNDLTDDIFFCAGADCDYVPTAGADGTDPAVTALRLTPTGTMAFDSGSGAPNFTILFRVLLQ